MRTDGVIRDIQPLIFETNFGRSRSDWGENVQVRKFVQTPNAISFHISKTDNNTPFPFYFSLQRFFKNRSYFLLCSVMCIIIKHRDNRRQRPRRAFGIHEGPPVPLRPRGSCRSAATRAWWPFIVSRSTLYRPINKQGRNGVLCSEKKVRIESLKSRNYRLQVKEI